jgi:hypothetical protein
MPAPSSPHPPLADWLAHVRALCEDIGPRGSTREGERLAAEYGRGAFARAGLTPRWEELTSARSVFRLHLAAGILYLACFAAYPLAGRVSAGVAALVCLATVVSQLQSLGMRANLLQLAMPKGRSQNVLAVIPPGAEHRRDIVLVGHLDTQRTPLVFRSAAWVKAYGLFTVIAMASFIGESLALSAGACLGLPWAWPAAAPGACCAALLAALCLEADATPFTAGANDNATGAGMVIHLAERIAAEPFPHTRVWAVLTGCEEVGQYGMADFLRRHRAEMRDPRAVVFEMLGGGDPGWLIREGVFVPFWSDPGLRRTAQRLSDDHPAWRAWGGSILGGNTELATAARAGVPGITLGAMKRNGEVPRWHQRGDTFDRLDLGCLERAEELCRAFVDAVGRE